MKIRRGLSSRIIAAAFLALLSLIVALPLYWTFTIAFRPNADLFMHRVVPSGFTIEHFEALIFFKKWAGFESVSFLVPLANSLLVALGATAISLIISIFAGYSLARIPFRGKKLISSYILLAYIFPPFILILSLYSFLHTVGLHNTLGGLILLHLIIVVPYCTWALRGFFLGVPKEIEEAALVDGCSRIEALIKIVLPISTPGVASAAIFSFTLSWGEMLFAMITLDSYEKFTLPIALRAMVIGDYVRWGSLMAGVVIAILPPVIFYLLLQKYIVQGLTAGATKG